MADSIIKLRLESQEYDAKLKRASEGLQRYAEGCRKAGGTLEHLDEGVEDFVKELGKMETVAHGAKGKLGEMTKVFTDLSVEYKHLTNQEKAAPFGIALSQSLDQLKIRIQESKRELSEIGDVINGTSSKGVGGGFLSGLGDKMSGALSVFGGNLMTKAAGMAASLVSELGDAVKQGVELAKQGEGIRIAFERLGRGDILDGLRKATHGTVTDIELMKAAVKFNDFKLPLEELGTMLAFAQQKAKDTGQSVDYMVDSIVTGLGRKSLMILDNLGLSAAEIKEKMAETGDMTKAVGEIIREQMAKAGDYMETAADRAAQANVSLQNKMEELGRQVLPLQESYNNLWTSMKIGILDIIGGPLTSLLNKLTEAGRLAQQYGVLGGNAKVGRLTANLAGASEANRQSIYQQQQQQFWRYINPREQQIKDIRAWQRGERSEALQGRINAITQKYGSLDATKIQAEVDAAKKMLADYQQAAKTILNPVKADINTSDAEQNVASLTKKLKELKAERAAAIKAGDSDKVKNLTQQINATQRDIKALDPNALKTTTGNKTTPQEKAAELVANAERTYAETLQKSAIRMEVGLDSTLEGKKKELSAQERLFDAYNDAYATYKDPKYKEAISESADKMKSLAGEVKQMEDVIAKSKVKWEQGESGFNSVTMAAWMKGRQGDLSKANYGTKEYQDITANIADMQTIKTIMEQRLKAGLNAADTDGIMESMWERVFDGENIQNDVWQSMVDTINEKLAEMNLEPIKINFETGNIDKEGKKFEKSWQAAASAVQSVGAAMSSIEDPAAKVAGTVAQAIASVALGYAQATKIAAETSGPWGWIAFAASGMATMLSTIASIHSATGYAQGGIVKGNSYSGDNILTTVGGSGSLAGLNAGELVLTQAQTAGLAQSIEGSGSRQVVVRGVIHGKDIFLSAENWAKSVGKGEFVTW